MTATITALNKMNYTVLDLAKATKAVAGLNAEADDPATYKVEKKDHGYVIAVYENGNFILNL